MNFFESVRIALRSLSANKLRSALTMLGIIIGVAAVIALMSVGRGVQKTITDQIGSMGTNLLFVSPGAANVGGVRENILAQFLTEATILSLMGGLIGIALGAGLAKLISSIQTGTTTITAVVGLDSVLLATLFAIAVGLVFGVYPAFRAAGLNPIDALHYE